MLDQTRLKNAIIAAFSEQAENTDHEGARDRVADKLAQAIINEIKEAKVQYTGGLIAPNGAVSGTINHTIQ
jgi:hypothetical protein